MPNGRRGGALRAPLRQLPLCHRTIRLHRSTISLHFRQLRRYPALPRTIGEHLRKKRIDMQLSMLKWQSYWVLE